MDNIIFQVEYNEQDKKYVIMKNISKMIVKRNIYDNDEIIYNDFMKNFDHDIAYFNDNTNVKIAIKFLFRKINTIRKIEDIEDFLTNYAHYHKFIIVSNISSKALSQILNYENTEVFQENDLMINIVDNILVPEHFILTDSEKEQFYLEFNLKKKEMGKILSSDPIARYYGMKPGDIVKIIRPSISSGDSIYYRICILNKILFLNK